MRNALREMLAGKYDEVGHVIDENVTEDVIWACTSCRACEIACPVFIEHTDKIYDIRRNLVMMESRFPAEVQPVFKNMETNATPWAFSALPNPSASIRCATSRVTARTPRFASAMSCLRLSSNPASRARIR